jgi:hypothetical protein
VPGVDDPNPAALPLIPVFWITGVLSLISWKPESLSEILVKWNGVQVLKELVTSPNAKVIITDGKSPMIINDATSH